MVKIVWEASLHNSPLRHGINFPGMSLERGSKLQGQLRNEIHDRSAVNCTKSFSGSQREEEVTWGHRGIKKFCGDELRERETIQNHTPGNSITQICRSRKVTEQGRWSLYNSEKFLLCPGIHRLMHWGLGGECQEGSFLCQEAHSQLTVLRHFFPSRTWV